MSLKYFSWFGSMKYNPCWNWCVSNALALSLIFVFKDPYLSLQMLKDVISFAYAAHSEQIFSGLVRHSSKLAKTVYVTREGCEFRQFFCGGSKNWKQL